jgi:hypothetical protein
MMACATSSHTNAAKSSASFFLAWASSVEILKRELAMLLAIADLWRKLHAGSHSKKL